MSMSATLQRWFKGAKSAPVEHKVADMLSDRSGITQDKFPSRVDGSAFVPGVSYFGVRLSGLHLVDARRFTTQQLPLCVCLAEFDHAGQRRTVPFSIGPDVIRQKLRDAGVKEESQARPAWVELIDLTVVRPTPVNEGNLALYAGLFSVPGNDLVRNLLNVVGTVGTALGQPGVGAGVKVAETIYDSFGSLLGLNEVQQVAAALIGSALTESGSGYLLIANIGAADFDPRRGRVVAGRLHWPLDIKQGAAVTEFDYALLALEQFDTIVQKATGMAPTLFQSLWTATLQAPKEQSMEALSKLQDAIASSPDVTEADRIALLTGYAVTFERLAKARWGDDAARVARGDAQASLGDRLAEAAIQVADVKSQAVHERALQAISAAATTQSTAWTGALPDSPTTETDDAVIDAALAVRSALLNSQADLPNTGQGLSALVNRTAGLALVRS